MSSINNLSPQDIIGDMLTQYMVELLKTGKYTKEKWGTSILLISSSEVADFTFDNNNHKGHPIYCNIIFLPYKKKKCELK